MKILLPVLVLMFTLAFSPAARAQIDVGAKYQFGFKSPVVSAEVYAARSGFGGQLGLGPAYINANIPWNAVPKAVAWSGGNTPIPVTTPMFSNSFRPAFQPATSTPMFLPNNNFRTPMFLPNNFGRGRGW